MYRRFTALLLCMTLLFSFAGCSKAPAKPKKDTAVVETTAPTEPAPTVPADGNPNDVTCKGTYSVSDDELLAARDAVVASMEGANLTNSQLQVYYWLEVAAHRASDSPDQPDYAQDLDTQSCPLDSSVGSWQQYFLRKALTAWHARQALVLQSQAVKLPVDPEYQPDPQALTEYMTGMPATEYLYRWEETYQPNRLHQDFLDAVPEMLNTLASDSGFGTNDAQAKAIAGAGADGRDLISYAHLLNFAYMYFTEMGYHFEPTAEEIETYATEHPSSNTNGIEKTVDIRHILLIPDNAEISADGTVTAGEDDWARCDTEARALLEKWQKRVRNTKFAQFAGDRVPEARFSEFAKDYSEDPGSRANGGLLVSLAQGQLAPELDAWCFDEARQQGDCEIIRSAAGYHIVFFRAANDPSFTYAENRLMHSLYRDLVTGAMETYPCKVDYSAIKLGVAADNGSFITPDHLLYPDVAHERFPDMPLYLQQTFPDAPFGNYTVSSHGCGITTLSMVASYLADDELTPAELAARYGYYCGERGSEVVIFDDTPAEMGFHLQNRSYSWPEMDAALKNGQVVVSLQWFGYWTRGGHYLAMIGMTEDDRYVVRDSNLINYKRVQNHVIDSHSRGSISEAGQYYWIYEPKVVSIPACARCGGDAEGTPTVMIPSDYTCEKCLTATSRRSIFLDGFSA